MEQDDVMLSFLIRDNASVLRRVNKLAEREGTSRAALYRKGIRLLLDAIDLDALRNKQETTTNDNE